MKMTLIIALATSVVMAAHAHRNPTMAVGFIGDSITSGSFVARSPVDAFANAFLDTAVITVNKAKRGTSSRDWTPGGGRFEEAKTAFSSSNVRIVHVIFATLLMVMMVVPFPLSLMLAGGSRSGKNYLVWQLFRRIHNR